MTTLQADPRGGATAPATLPARSSPSAATPWIWAAAACLLLGGSIGARAWQDRRFQVEEERGVAAIDFDLDAMPSVVGRFRSEEGIGPRLDPETVRYAGGLDHLVRTYTDEQTGVRLLVMVLYGRADRVVEHVPELCYVGAGYSQLEESLDQPLEFRGPDGATEQAVFRSGVYAKRLGGVVDSREESFHAFRNRTSWSPESPLSGHNRRPVGVYKIQVQRRLGRTERREAGDASNREHPSEAFLAEFVAAFESLLAEARSNPDPAP